MSIQYKSLDYAVKDIDETGVVSIYVNAFGNEDSDGDISQRGAFAKTLQENFKRVKHFLNHDSKLLLGVPLEGVEDEVGLLMRSKLNLKKEIGRDAYEDYKLYAEHGKTLEHSIGFNVIKRDPSDAKVITEYKLWEYSTLTAWGANPLTPLADLKNQKDAKALVTHLTQMYNLDYSDARLKSIETLLISLETGEPAPTTPPPAEPSDLDLIDNFIKRLKSA
ncbi:HK97 family phage prohead protease [Nibribacter koreensis]|uniref:Prohead serine protease domain-containing protein n=1 Tax=Nibribacter koreensis TaxID=1084519 RepID=A0ABP8FB84_9BACT